MLFKKGVVPSSSNLLGNKDRKKLRSLVSLLFPHVSEDIIDEELLPKSGELTVQRIQGSKTLIYSVDKVPLLFDTDGSGDLFPSIYACSRVTNILPAFIIHPPVSGFVLGGADLMLPGVIPPTVPLDVAYPPDGLLKQRRMAVRVAGNPVCFAVGRCLVSNDEFVGGKGRALEVLHVFNDVLWGLGPKIKLEGFQPKKVNAIENPPVEDTIDRDAVLDTDAAEPTGANDEGDNGIKKVDELEESHPSESADLAADGSSEAIMAEGISTLPVDKQSQGAVDTVASPVSKSVASVPPKVMDGFLEYCLLEILHTELPDSALPISASGIWSKMLATAGVTQLRPGFRELMLKENAEPLVIDELFRGNLVLLPDAKHSTHKKLAKFFQAYAKKKLLQTKEIRSELRILSIDRKHELYVKYTPASDKEKRQAKKILADTEKPTSASSTIAAATTAAATPTENATSTGLRILEFYLPSNKMSAVFNASGMKPAVQNRYFTAQQARQALNEYIKKENLALTTDPTKIAVDDILADCLLTKDERQEAKNVTPTKSALNDITVLRPSCVVLSRDDAAKRFMGALLPFTATLPAGEELDNVILTSGKLASIKLGVEKRARKHVTTVKNMQQFGVDAKLLAEFLQRSLAASASVCENLEAKGKNKPLAVMVQGAFIPEISAILQKEFGIPKQYIDG